LGFWKSFSTHPPTTITQVPVEVKLLLPLPAKCTGQILSIMALNYFFKVICMKITTQNRKYFCAILIYEFLKHFRCGLSTLGNRLPNPAEVSRPVIGVLPRQKLVTFVNPQL
jgi:hypothetical protein